MSRADAPGQGALTAYRSLSRLQAQPAQPCCLRARNARRHARPECYGLCAQNATGHPRRMLRACARRMLRGMRAQNATGHARAECYGACARRMLRGMRPQNATGHARAECNGACAQNDAGHARRMLRGTRAQNATGHARVGSNTWICRHKAA